MRRRSAAARRFAVDERGAPDGTGGGLDPELEVAGPTLAWCDDEVCCGQGCGRGQALAIGGAGRRAFGGVPVECCRMSSTRRDAGRALRRALAKAAFSSASRISSEYRYLLLQTLGMLCSSRHDILSFSAGHWLSRIFDMDDEVGCAIRSDDFCRFEMLLSNGTSLTDLFGLGSQDPQLNIECRSLNTKNAGLQDFEVKLAFLRRGC
jgi:hypothetical protein